MLKAMSDPTLYQFQVVLTIEKGAVCDFSMVIIKQKHNIIFLRIENSSELQS